MFLGLGISITQMAPTGFPSAPSGYAYLIDSDGKYLVDVAGAYMIGAV